MPESERSTEAEAQRDDQRGQREWAVTLIALAALVLVAVVIVIAIPGGGGTATQQTPLELHSAFPQIVAPGKASAVDLQVGLDSIDAASGTLSLRVVAAPGAVIPAEGATVFTTIAAAPYIVVRPDQLNQERSAVLSFAGGDVADYPFDVYRADIRFIAVAGTSTSVAKLSMRRVLPVSVVASTAVAGFSVTASARVAEERANDVTIQMRRTTAVRTWVLSMMAIYWVLALLVVGIAYSVLKGRRAWETRLLAWVTALLFALIVLRNAAPGAPPVGAFFDFFAVFESVGIVAIALAVLMIHYLVGPRSRLES